MTYLLMGLDHVKKHPDAYLEASFYNMIGKGLTAADMYRATPTKEFDAKWGDPKQFIANVYPGLWNHVRELGREAYGIV